MLTKRENFVQMITGGTPEYYVNQFSYFQLTPNPWSSSNPRPKRGELNVVNKWGVTNSWREDQPGSFPVHTPDKIVIKDITEWRDYVKAPVCKFSDAEWEPFIAQAEKVDKNEVFLGCSIAPGIFEQTHYLGELTETLCNYLEEPEEMKDLVKYIADWELQLAEDLCDHLHPELIFHHDDWGTQQNTFFSPEIFEEFFLEPYSQVYGYYKERGVKYIVHHSDSYGETLVPSMIKMGIDAWQGVLGCNDIPMLIEKYGSDIAFMGGIDSTILDKADWNEEQVKEVVNAALDRCGKKAFIPCLTRGTGSSIFPGVYDAVSAAIDERSRTDF